jgi:peptidoglycan-associated lipoprotein
MAISKSSSIRVWGFAALAAAAIALTGCPAPYPSCSSDEACKDHGEVCVNGQCQECGSDANCKPGFTCEANKCVPKAECTADGDCKDGICNNGKCGPPECKDDKGCKEGKCRTGRCVVGACNSSADCKNGEQCRDVGFNETGLSQDARSQLGKVADCIKREKGKVTLEGHADERGTEEYNLQLSNRRAASVKKYLNDLGVKGKQLDAVGFGETRPAVEGSSEDAWSTNRRVEFRR